MNKEKLNLVPQAVLDVAEAIRTNKNAFTRDIYIMRLEAIQEFCAEELDRLKVLEKVK